MILSTLYEVICVKIKAKPNEMTAAMSLYSNGKYLFTMRQKKDHIQVLHGLRALSLIWLMLGYRFILPLIVPLINPLDFATDVSQFGCNLAFKCFIFGFCAELIMDLSNKTYSLWTVTSHRGYLHHSLERMCFCSSTRRSLLICSCVKCKRAVMLGYGSCTFID